jgi:hypothetical protein
MTVPSSGLLPLDPIVKVIELIVKLINMGQKSRYNVFREYLTPLFEGIRSVHVFYADLFAKALQSLPIEGNNARWGIPGIDPEITVTTDMIAERVATVKKEFLQGRNKDLSVRDEVRTGISVIFGKVKHLEEKRFVVAFAYYFLEEPAVLDEESIDLEIKYIEEAGGILALGTPATYLLNYMEKKEEPTELRRIFEGALRTQNQKFQQVSKTFAELKFLMSQHP